MLLQTYKNIEVLVIDDGSTDNTSEILKQYGSRIRYIYQDHKGISAARNTGIQSANGDFIALLDSDDIWLPPKLEKQMLLFAQYPVVGLISCGAILIDVDGNQIEKLSVKNYEKNEQLLRALLLKNVISCGGSSAVIKKECFEKIGLFDEALHAAEDWDMWFRITAKYKVHFIDQPYVKIRVSGNSMSAPANAKKMIFYEMRMLKKLFFNSPTHFSRYDRGMAFSHRYFSTAWALMQTKKRLNALGYIIRSLLANPFHFVCQKDYFALLIRIMTGDVLFQIIRQKKAKGT